MQQLRVCAGLTTYHTHVPWHIAGRMTSAMCSLMFEHAGTHDDSFPLSLPHPRMIAGEMSRVLLGPPS